MKKIVVSTFRLLIAGISSALLLEEFHGCLLATIKHEKIPRCIWHPSWQQQKRSYLECCISKWIVLRFGMFTSRIILYINDWAQWYARFRAPFLANIIWCSQDNVLCKSFLTLTDWITQSFFPITLQIYSIFSCKHYMHYKYFTVIS